MKYVRLNDGRIGKVTHEDNKNYRAKFGRKCPLVSKGDVIKVAESIEELCDWIILKLNGTIYRLYKSLDLAIECEGNDIGLYEVICSIETNKGLIYVAEMNEKGEIELL